MPKIKPFMGIRPAPEYASKVVLQVENLSIEGAREIRDENPLSYVNLLVPKLENRYLRASREEQAYKKINENFEDFLEKGILIQDANPAIYIYKIDHLDLVQTGIWTVTSIDDYLNNTIKKHELTRIEREKSLMNYLDEAGLDANPVLITFHPQQELEEIINKECSRDADMRFEKDGKHSIWKIDDTSTVQKIVSIFENLPVTYIADGHHRAAAASLLGMQRRRYNLKHNGTEEYNYFNSVYIPTNDLKIVEFNRLCKVPGDFNIHQFIELLRVEFEITQSQEPVRSSKKHEFGMYYNRMWYILQRKPSTKNISPVENLDVSILQSHILYPFLGITDPRHDKNIDFVGGLTTVTELASLVDSGEFDIAFTLFPTSIEELIEVANAGEVMPPKSTWFEPKFLAGLVIHKY